PCARPSFAVATAPDRLPACSPFGQPHPPAARRLPGVSSPRSELPSAAAPASPLRPGPTAIPGFALRAGTVRHGNSPPVFAIACATGLVPPPTRLGAAQSPLPGARPPLTGVSPPPTLLLTAWPPAPQPLGPLPTP